jgi:hypothetical protein
VGLNEEKSLWACGLRARAALYNLIRGQVIACMRGRRVQRRLHSGALYGVRQRLGRVSCDAGLGSACARGLGLYRVRLRLRSARSADCGPAGGGLGRLHREPTGYSNPTLRNGPRRLATMIAVAMRLCPAASIV